MGKKLPRFYAITDRKRFKLDLEKQIEVMKTKGASIVQLREKDLNSYELFNLARRFREITERHNLMLIINDRVDIALMVKADGVHLPEKSIPISVIKSKFTHLIVGKSCHSIECAINSEKEGADYIFFSPIFHVENKGMPVGIKGLKEVVNAVNIPVYALGGITKKNIEEVLKAGAYGVAGIRLFII